MIMMLNKMMKNVKKKEKLRQNSLSENKRQRLWTLKILLWTLISYDEHVLNLSFKSL